MIRAIKGTKYNSMISRFDRDDMPDLQTFPSAQAQDYVPIKGDAAPPSKHKKTRRFVWFWRGFIAVLILGVVSVGLLAIMLSRGSVSHEQLRVQIENQLNDLLGEGNSARIGDANISFGKNGFLAIDTSNVRFLRNNEISLGEARKVAVKVKALPLLRGKVVADSVIVQGASVSLAQFLPETKIEPNRFWPSAIDFTAGFSVIGEMFSRLSKSINDGGLESISFLDTKLLGFDRLKFRASQARLIQLKVEKDINYQKGLFFNLEMETDHNNWVMVGSWTESEQGGNLLSLKIDGMNLSDFFGGRPDAEQTISKFNSPIQVLFAAPFNPDGTPRQATMSVQLGEGELELQGEPVSHILAGRLNFRFFPEKNQIELERSPVQLETTQAVILGGIRYPRSNSSTVSTPPIFQLIANDLHAYGMTGGKAKMLAALNFDGWIDVKNQTLNATTLLLKTPNGSVTGTGKVSFDGRLPHLSADLTIPQMALTDLKQFWPKSLAKGARKWARNGFHDGQIKDAKLKLDFPPGVLGKEKLYTAKNITATVPVYGATVKTVGELPPLQKANAVVVIKGKKTTVKLVKGFMSLGARGSVNVGESLLELGDHTLPKTTASLSLSLSGKASALAKLGTLKPINFANKLKIVPADLRGSAKAKVKAKFLLEDVEKNGVQSWSSVIQLTNAGSRKPINGRIITDANLKIVASAKGAEINGTARIDGVVAKLALFEGFDGKQGSQRTVKLTLTDAARKRMGADTGSILTGPIVVEVTTLKNGQEKITANLRNAKLNFPWIGWSKGKGIPATASFVIKRQKGRTVLQDFSLKGKGFSARGTMEMDSKGLAKAKLNKVRLNKTDDFDVSLSRTRHGYAITVNARSYDGRAIIQSFMNNDRPQPKGGISVLVKGKIAKLTGFGGQKLREVDFHFSQKGKRVGKVSVFSMAEGKAPTIFKLSPVSGGSKTEISTSNAGSVLRFLNLYTKIRGGTLSTVLVQDKSRVFRGNVTANNFTLLGEPRLAKLLRKPTQISSDRNSVAVIKKLRAIKSDSVKIDQLQMRVEKGRGFLNIKKGRLTGGDASAAFKGQVYNKNNRMKIKGTFLPGRAINRLVSKIPLIGLAFGKGKVNGLFGITFKLSGVYGNPSISVNPLSIIAPGVFRQLFKF